MVGTGCLATGVHIGDVSPGIGPIQEVVVLVGKVAVHHGPAVGEVVSGTVVVVVSGTVVAVVVVLLGTVVVVVVVVVLLGTVVVVVVVVSSGGAARTKMDWAIHGPALEAPDALLPPDPRAISRRTPLAWLVVTWVIPPGVLSEASARMPNIDT